MKVLFSSFLVLSGLLAVLSGEAVAQSDLNDVKPKLVLDSATEEWLVKATDRPGFEVEMGPQDNYRAREMDLQVRRQKDGQALGVVTGVQQSPSGEIFVYQGAFRNISVVGDDIYLSTFGGLGLGYDSQSVLEVSPYYKADRTATETKAIAGASLGLRIFECLSVEVRNDYQKGLVNLDEYSRPFHDTGRLNSTLRFQTVKYSGCKRAKRFKKSGLEEETDKLLFLLKQNEEWREHNSRAQGE